MRWTKEYAYLSEYEEAGRNQHGIRYKQSGTKRVSVATLSAKSDNPTDMRQLILLSNFLDVPVRYDFDADPQVAYIKVVSQERYEKDRKWLR